MTPWDSEAEMLAALEQAKATLHLEGIELTREELELAERRAREGMSDEQFLKLALALAERATSSAGKM